MILLQCFQHSALFNLYSFLICQYLFHCVLSGDFELSPLFCQLGLNCPLTWLLGNLHRPELNPDLTKTERLFQVSSLPLFCDVPWFFSHELAPSNSPVGLWYSITLFYWGMSPWWHDFSPGAFKLHFATWEVVSIFFWNPFNAVSPFSPVRMISPPFPKRSCKSTLILKHVKV